MNNKKWVTPYLLIIKAEKLREHIAISACSNNGSTGTTRACLIFAK